MKTAMAAYRENTLTAGIVVRAASTIENTKNKLYNERHLILSISLFYSITFTLQPSPSHTCDVAHTLIVLFLCYCLSEFTILKFK